MIYTKKNKNKKIIQPLFVDFFLTVLVVYRVSFESDKDSQSGNEKRVKFTSEEKNKGIYSELINQWREWRAIGGAYIHEHEKERDVGTLEHQTCWCCPLRMDPTELPWRRGLQALGNHSWCRNSFLTAWAKESRHRSHFQFSFLTIISECSSFCWWLFI